MTSWKRKLRFRTGLIDTVSGEIRGILHAPNPLRVRLSFCVPTKTMGVCLVRWPGAGRSAAVSGLSGEV